MWWAGELQYNLVAREGGVKVVERKRVREGGAAAWGGTI